MSRIAPSTPAAEIVTIGDELLLGQIVDTNAAWLASRLSVLGVRVGRVTSCGDDEASIREAIREAGSRARLVIVTGGLGPTEDDRTVQAVAALQGVEVERDAEALRRIEQRRLAAGAAVSEADRRQADVPRGAEVLPNPAGMAPGFAVDLPGGARAYFLPGVPREMEAIFDGSIAPRIEAMTGRSGRARLGRTFRVVGLRESVLDERLRDLEGAASGEARVELHYRSVFPENHVTLVVEGEPAEAARLLQRLDAEIRHRLGRHVYGTGDESLPKVVGTRLRERGATLALAESCTGGLIGHLVTEIPGASDYLLLGVVAYSNEAKQKLLGVRAATLERHGAVSEATVREMAEGVRGLAAATYGVAVSGIAGPGGGSPEKPVGTVHVAVAGPSGTMEQGFLFPFGRDMVKRAAAWAALEMVLRMIDATGAGEGRGDVRHANGRSATEENE